MIEKCRFYCAQCNKETEATLSFGGNPKTCKVVCNECQRSVIFSRYAVGRDIVIMPKLQQVIIPVVVSKCDCKSNFGKPLHEGQLHEVECPLRV